MKKNVYLAAPFFSDNQVQRMRSVANQLFGNKYIDDVYIPMDNQQDMIVEKFGSLQDAMLHPEWQHGTYHADLNALTSADVVVAILDYDDREPDSGTMFEVGYAVANNIPVVLVEFQQNEEPLNLMLAHAYTAYFWGKKDIQTLSDYNFLRMPYKSTSKEVF